MSETSMTSPSELLPADVLERCWERARVVPAGGAGMDAFVRALFAWALLGFGNIYYGLARRVLDMTVAAVRKKTSIALSRTMAHHPQIQAGVAAMVLDLEPVGPHLDAVARDWTRGVDHGEGWDAKIVAAKHVAVESSWRAVDRSLDLVGGFGIFSKAGFERLFRDARLGRIHPANPMLTHELIGKHALGVDPDEQPRWG